MQEYALLATLLSPYPDPPPIEDVHMFACLALCSYFIALPVPVVASCENSPFAELPFDAGIVSAPAMTAESTPRRFSVSLYYADVEFDEIDLEATGTATLLEVPRERIGVQFGFKAGYARVYREEIEEFEGFGFGAGAQGRYIPNPSASAAFLIDYDVSLDLGFLEDDDFDAEILNLALEGKIGAGVAVQSFHAAAGLSGSFITGTLEIPGIEDIDVEGQNFGFYVGLGFMPLDVPVKARIDVHFGDIEGVALSLGYAF